MTHDVVQYDIPEMWGNGNDNVIANGQIVSIEPTYVHELHFLYAGDSSGGEFVKNFVLNFEDNSTLTVQCERELDVTKVVCYDS